jgi:hypothetical protein
MRWKARTHDRRGAAKKYKESNEVIHAIHRITAMWNRSL